MADIAELIVALKLRDGVSGGLGRLNGQLRGMSGGLSDVGRGIGSVAGGFDRIATRGAIAAAAGLGAVVTAAVSFEDAFAGVRKTVDASESEFGALEDRLREMARTMPVSFEELAAITEAGGALGIAFAGLDEFTDTVAKLAVTTDLSADQAATSLGVLGNVLNLRAEDFDNFGSALVDLGNKGSSTESQILDIAERIGATGSLIGLRSDQVLGFGAAVANVGIEAEAGGSALQRFFIDALTAVESGGEDLETFARTAGVSAESFRDSFREDAGTALNDFIEGLGQLPEAVQIETLADLGFNDVRITRTLLGLAGDVNGLEDSLRISAEAFAANSALGEEAAKRFGTTANQLKILKQNVVDAAVVIGEQLLPVVGELTTDFVAFLNKPETQRNIKEFGENLAGGIRDFVAEIRKADLAPLIDTLKGAAAIAKGAFDTFRSLPPEVQQIALAALVANKVTGGAVGQIAGGLGSILKGVIQISFGRGESPARPLFVSAVGGGLGGTGGTATTGGGIGAAFGAAFAAALGVQAGAAIAGPIYEATVKPAKDFFTGQVDEIAASADPTKIREGIAALDAEIDKWEAKPRELQTIMQGYIDTVKAQRDRLAAELPVFGPPLPPKGTSGLSKMQTVLPDTAMQPLVGALTGLTLAIKGSKGFGTSPFTKDVGNFVPTVKLDASQVTDLRDPVVARLWEIEHGDQLLFQTAARQLGQLQEHIRIANAAASSDQAMLGYAAGQSSKLDTANALLGGINAKNFNPPAPKVFVTVNSSLSTSVIANGMIQNQIVSGTSSAASGFAKT